jgi:DNA-binding transcriptional LysR family regulator
VGGRARKPFVSLAVTCDLTLNLLERFRQDEMDIAFLKREPTIRLAGVMVWRKPLVWIAGDGYRLPCDGAVPLVVSPEPCVYRKRATDTLKRARRAWRIAYSCGSLAGKLAAVKAGLGVSVLPKDMVPADLRALSGADLPRLRDTETALMSRPKLSAPARRLHAHVMASLERSAHSSRSRSDGILRTREDIRKTKL